MCFQLSFCKVFIAALIIVTVGFSITKRILNVIWPRFRQISPEHKKWYVVGNLWKAFLLGSMTCCSTYWYYTMTHFLEDNWSQHSLDGYMTKKVVVMYSITDVVALYMIPKLPKSTIIHHVGSFAFAIGICLYDIQLAGKCLACDSRCPPIR